MRLLVVYLPNDKSLSLTQTNTNVPKTNEPSFYKKKKKKKNAPTATCVRNCIYRVLTARESNILLVAKNAL